ncbi:MAG: hypothetical protein JSR82_06745 [Verrucomicrobia bacterium]|nr:hypothetical protein [Verrucomicrobiota bacterium]
MKLRSYLFLALTACTLAAQENGSQPAPNNLRGFESQVGQSFSFLVTGNSRAGSVWGTDQYTTDSALAAAAVHAGAVTDGASAVVRVTLTPGLASYQGSARHGVTSAAWGAYAASYRVEALGGQAQADPGSLTSLAARKTGSFLFEVTGAATGSVWGTDLYTADSRLAAAAVHAGVLKPGERGVVKVTLEPGQASYAGTARNGVTSSAWGAYAVSYRVELSESVAGSVPLAPPNLESFKDRVGQSLVFRVTGTTSGSVWGTDKYTCDSALGAAAVHAGLLRPGETANLRVTFSPGESSYSGTARNGVNSNGWGSYPASFTLARE